MVIRESRTSRRDADVKRGAKFIRGQLGKPPRQRSGLGSAVIQRIPHAQVFIAFVPKGGAFYDITRRETPRLVGSAPVSGVVTLGRDADGSRLVHDAHHRTAPSALRTVTEVYLNHIGALVQNDLCTDLLARAAELADGIPSHDKFPARRRSVGVVPDIAARAWIQVAVDAHYTVVGQVLVGVGSVGIVSSCFAGIK